MPVFHKCSRRGCTKILPEGTKYCDMHIKEKFKEEKIRNKKYKQSLKDSRENKFYSTDKWIRLRDTIRIKCLGLCLICYFKGRYEDLYTIHHIEDIKDNWDRRLDNKNLIGLCQHHHIQVHKEYDKSKLDKAKMQKLLFSLLEKFKEEYGEV